MDYRDIRVGDKLLVAYRGGFDYAKTVKVTRLTPHQIITEGEHRYWKKNGDEVNSLWGHIIKMEYRDKDAPIRSI